MHPLHPFRGAWDARGGRFPPPTTTPTLARGGHRAHGPHSPLGQGPQRPLKGGPPCHRTPIPTNPHPHEPQGPYSRTPGRPASTANDISLNGPEGRFAPIGERR
ncbi:hypothetical protein COCOBI_pt-1230 (chloroplast) [Coccomyxa sp. Obi]|nr:hypothetical protein COCOBI_pt-1230 [Coccomyxa sp. Obi]